MELAGSALRGGGGAGAAGWKSKVLLGADLWAGDDLAVVDRE